MSRFDSGHTESSRFRIRPPVQGFFDTGPNAGWDYTAKESLDRSLSALQVVAGGSITWEVIENDVAFVWVTPATVSVALLLILLTGEILGKTTQLVLSESHFNSRSEDNLSVGENTETGREISYFVAGSFPSVSVAVSDNCLLLQRGWISVRAWVGPPFLTSQQ